MESQHPRNHESEQRIVFSKQRKEHNLEALDRRLHELDIEKQKRKRVTDRKEGMV